MTTDWERNGWEHELGLLANFHDTRLDIQPVRVAAKGKSA
jgi:hypothetical protein